MTTTAERIFALIQENIGWVNGDERTVKTIAAEIDNLTARLGAQVDLTIETEKQLGIVRATRDDYLRRLTEAEAELEKCQPKREKSLNERGVIALEKIAEYLGPGIQNLSGATAYTEAVNRGLPTW